MQAVNAINHFGGNIRLYAAGGDRITAADTTPTGVWVHYTFTREGSNYKIYTNGVETDSTSGSLVDFTYDAIGRGPGGSLDGFFG